jgi:hypothetical protein
VTTEILERGSKMFKQTLQRMVLTAATVMVLASMAAPAAMATPAVYQEQPNISEGSYYGGESAYLALPVSGDPDVICRLLPWSCLPPKL